VEHGSYNICNVELKASCARHKFDCRRLCLRAHNCADDACSVAEVLGAVRAVDLGIDVGGGLLHDGIFQLMRPFERQPRTSYGIDLLSPNIPGVKSMQVAGNDNRFCQLFNILFQR